MKRLAMALSLSLACVTLVAAPATAGHTWHQSGCRPDVWYYHVAGQYVNYYREGSQWPTSVFAVHENWPRHAFARRHLQVYADNGYECGRMGPPLGDMVRNGPGWWRQSMERGALWYNELNQLWIWCPFGDQWCYYT